ncbi:LacI family DNA-binding transcriptional regulator [Salegentibacter sp. T436]|uniref:LacI family DNA-binding transcriptional regulator n=1 Tax=Salegentibacter sp. T436 TaxID=1729720 RepID=UPI00094A591C|nr:LacI family DNA-binding transcriptional regulator [Salegentibacter sp. T436]APS40563.1 LacI family transcriptional regulator [Salegentibacter sp. T436]
MKKKVSLKDIAKKVGVSAATVSYVLSKDKESKVSVEVAEKVKKAAKELNYQPNQIAKSLKMGKTFTIGLIVADISNPFFSHIARIIEDEATKLNYTVIFGSSDERPDKSWDLLNFLANRQVDGFILAPTEGSEHQIKYLKEQNIPFVLIDRYFPDLDTNYVVIDNYQAAFDAVIRLIDTGHKRIGMLAYLNSLHHMGDRVKGYEKAMKKHKLRLDSNWLQEINFFDMELEVKSAIDKMLGGDTPIDALFFATNTLAIIGLKYLNSLNYRIPSDLAIISFDQGEAFDFYYCPLTYIKQPLDELARNAVKILTQQIESPAKATKKVCLPAQLVIRNSCSK